MAVQLVYATGCVTAVGLDSAQTCAAIRARQSGIEAAVAQAGEPLMAAAVPAQGRLKKSQQAWLMQLAMRALRECLRNYRGDSSRLALFIALPEPARDHEITRDGTGHAFASHLVRSLGLQLSHHSRVMLDGHASAAIALQAAAGLLEQHEIDGALIGGVDSMLGDIERDRLHQTGRLHEPGNPFGLIPGEAAAFVLTGGESGLFSQAAIACVPGVASAVESNHIQSDRYSVGSGLKHAIVDALRQARMDEDRIKWRVTDMNGERHRGWESTALLARHYRAWRNGLPCLHLPAYSGDVGCASLPLQIIVAAHGMQMGYAPGPLAVCESASEGFLRGACLVAPVAGARQPPFHARIGNPSGEEGAAISRQIQRLPNELAWLAQRRASIVRGRETLAGLDAFDERIEAQLALLRAAGKKAWASAVEAIAESGSGGLFAPAVLAIESGDSRRLDEVLAAADGTPESLHDASLLSAFGWASAQSLKGVVTNMASSPSTPARLLATVAMHLHRAQPGDLLWALLDDSDPAVRKRALRLAGEVGVRAGLERVQADLVQDDRDMRHAAAQSALLLGDRGLALDALEQIAESDSQHNTEALLTFARAADLPRFRRLLRQTTLATSTRRLIQACGAAGDSQCLPWLIRQMEDPQSARLAGEVFTLITGQDLDAGRLALTGSTRRTDATGDDAEGESPEPDPDAGLPWPDAEKIAAWWQLNHHALPPGSRHLMGIALSPEQCLRVLKSGSQRQRREAARQLAVLQPGTGLFNTSAPAWRQRHSLL